MKAHRVISLDMDINKDIQTKTNTQGFDFSRWVTEAYIKEFFSEDYLTKEVAKLEQALSSTKEQLLIQQSILPPNIWKRLSLEEQQDIQSLTIKSKMLYGLYLNLKLKWAWDINFPVFFLLVRDYGYKG